MKIINFQNDKIYIKIINFQNAGIYLPDASGK